MAGGVRLREKLIQHIREKTGPMTSRNYMAACLYD